MPVISHSGYDLVQFSESRSGELKASDLQSILALRLNRTLAAGAQIGIIGCYAGDVVPNRITVDTAFKMALSDRPDCEVISHDRLSYSNSFVLEALDDGKMRFRVNN